MKKHSSYIAYRLSNPKSKAIENLYKSIVGAIGLDVNQKNVKAALESMKSPGMSGRNVFDDIWVRFAVLICFIFDSALNSESPTLSYIQFEGSDIIDEGLKKLDIDIIKEGITEIVNGGIVEPPLVANWGREFTREMIEDVAHILLHFASKH